MTGLVVLGLLSEWVVAVVAVEWEEEVALKKPEVGVVMVVGAEEYVLAEVARLRQFGRVDREAASAVGAAAAAANVTVELET